MLGGLVADPFYPCSGGKPKIVANDITDALQVPIRTGSLKLCYIERSSPQDNAFMESFFKTLKAEEVWLEDYADIEHADESICGFIRYYNSERMHSALGYLSPEQFEAQLQENDQS